jgi:hypothetical protein
LKEGQQVVSASTYQVVLQKLESLQAVYQVRHVEQVVGFLQRNPSFLPLLEAAVAPVRQAFGQNVQIALQIEDDPDNSEPPLVALIQTSDEPETALDKLHSFDRAWWLSVVSTTLSKFIFHIEYQPAPAQADRS